MLNGAQPRESIPVDLNDLVSNLEDVLRRTLGERIQIITSLPMRVRPVQGDPAELRQAIMNLAVNAREAMPQGGTLTIETRNGEAPRKFRRAACQRHGVRHGGRDAEANLRTVLHHESARAAKRIRLVHRLRHRAEPGWHHCRRQRAWPRNDIHLEIHRDEDPLSILRAPQKPAC